MYDLLQVRTRRPYDKEDEKTTRDKVTKIKTIMVRTFFSLEVVMPNGKKFGDCTGKEVGQWGSQFFRLSRAVGPSKIREVFPDDEKLKEFCV